MIYTSTFQVSLIEFWNPCFISFLYWRVLNDPKMISEENMPQPWVPSPESSSLCHLAEKPSIFLAEDSGGANGMFATNFQVTHALQEGKVSTCQKYSKDGRWPGCTGFEGITHSLAVASDNKHRHYNALKLGVPSGLGENASRAALSGPRNLHPCSMSPVMGWHTLPCRSIRGQAWASTWLQLSKQQEISCYHWDLQVSAWKQGHVIITVSLFLRVLNVVHA